jgi:hypothetical protein
LNENESNVDDEDVVDMESIEEIEEDVNKNELLEERKEMNWENDMKDDRKGEKNDKNDKIDKIDLRELNEIISEWNETKRNHNIQIHLPRKLVNTIIALLLPVWNFFIHYYSLCVHRSLSRFSSTPEREYSSPSIKSGMK